MILYTENCKDIRKKLFKVISEFSKVTRYNINKQKYVASLYTKDDLSEKEIKKAIPLTNASKVIKIPGNNCYHDGKRTVH